MVVVVVMVAVVIVVVVAVVVVVVVVFVLAVQDPRGHRRGRGGCHRSLGHPLVSLHRDGGQDPHPHVIGLVQRDRNGVDTKEVGGQQDRIRRMVGGQLGQGGHRRQGTGIGRV